MSYQEDIMKKIALIFTIFMFYSSMSFAGAIDSVGKMVFKGKAACNIASAATTSLDESVADVCGNVGDAASVAGVAATGYAVAGASGPSIMSTMATAGATVGGGVVAGVGLVGGAGGVGAAKLMNDHLYTDCQDQAACDAAQIGTYTGAATGTVASVGTLVLVGAGPTGLATVGAAVGGGMAAGATTVVVAPIVAAVVIGGAVYWLFSD
jgi:hypothetical protein